MTALSVSLTRVPSEKAGRLTPVGKLFTQAMDWWTAALESRPSTVPTADTDDRASWLSPSA